MSIYCNHLGLSRLELFAFFENFHILNDGFRACQREIQQWGGERLLKIQPGPYLGPNDPFERTGNGRR